MAANYGGIEKVYDKYFDTLMMSLTADLGPFKPRRIGHITLVRKFHLKYPSSQELLKRTDDVLALMKEQGYELDYNGAGLAKPLCREPYPPDAVIEKALSLGVPLVYGSDAHRSKELGQGIEAMKKFL
jgi:histidinol-phosphatase (PHP family)